jgi:hypothetical protein
MLAHPKGNSSTAIMKKNCEQFVEHFAIKRDIQTKY